MADNYLFDQGSSLTGAADDVGGVLYPRWKPSFGPDGSAVDVSSAAPIPASATAQSASMMVGTVVTTPSFARITASASGANTVVAVSSLKQIRVVAWDITTSASQEFLWCSASSASLLAGTYYTNGAGGGVARGFNQAGYFQTASSEALVLHLERTSSLGGALTYILV
jgi:hypothetical protein